jgi:Na+-driven multidrug efflux pump
MVYFCAKGNPEYLTYGSLISLALVIVLDVILIPTVGLVGAALALTSSHFVVGIITVYWFCKQSKKPLREVLIPSRWDLALCRAALPGWGRNE